MYLTRIFESRSNDLPLCFNLYEQWSSEMAASIDNTTLVAPLGTTK